MTSLLLTFNLLEDPDMMDDIDTFELRVVNHTLTRLTDPTDDATLVLTGVLDRKRIPLHDFEDDFDTLPDVLESLFEDGATVWYKDESTEFHVTSFEDFADNLEAIKDGSDLLENLFDTISGLL